MKDVSTGAATRVKQRVRNRELFRDKFHFKKEASRIGVMLFMLLALVIGGLSLLAFASGLYQYFQQG